MTHASGQSNADTLLHCSLGSSLSKYDWNQTGRADAERALGRELFGAPQSGPSPYHEDGKSCNGDEPILRYKNIIIQ